MPTLRARCGTVLAAALTTLLAVAAAPAAPPAAAQGRSGPGGPANTTPPVKINSSDPDLKLRSGAKLAAGRVLDIKSVVETEGGDERREDTNVDVTFALQAEVLFDKDSSRLSREAGKRISAIAAEAKKQKAGTLRVFGFTDNLGSAEHGLALSKERAGAVQRQLAEEIGSSSVAYQIRGYGEQFPIADNSTEEGRTKNRRVEVSFPRRG
ncbi:OmpA family protein [Streptomyces nondiastaticus]|uniref:OmpA family protein n=1 Tax=Streptomyces nondiastaticus TaxID=3154512 RepID=A0ABW6U6V2_9ACTN